LQVNGNLMPWAKSRSNRNHSTSSGSSGGSSNDDNNNPRNPVVRLEAATIVLKAEAETSGEGRPTRG